MLPVGSTNISESKINHSISPQWKKQLQNLWPVTWLWQPLIQCLEMPVIRWVFWSWRTDICHRRRLDNLWGLIRLAGGVIIYAKQDVFCFIKRNVRKQDWWLFQLAACHAKFGIVGTFGIIHIHRSERVARGWISTGWTVSRIQLMFSPIWASFAVCTIYVLVAIQFTLFLILNLNMCFLRR